MINGKLIIDNLAGGGGASTGIEMATGYSVDITINHDSEAIRMHQLFIRRSAMKRLFNFIILLLLVVSCIFSYDPLIYAKEDYASYTAYADTTSRYPIWINIAIAVIGIIVFIEILVKMTSELLADSIYFYIPLEEQDGELKFKKIYICTKKTNVTETIEAIQKYNDVFDIFNTSFTRETPNGIPYSKEISNDRNILFLNYQFQLKIIYSDLKDWRRRYRKAKDSSQLDTLIDELNSNIEVIELLAKTFVRDINRIDYKYIRFNTDYKKALKSLGKCPDIPLFENVIIPQCDELS